MEKHEKPNPYNHSLKWGAVMGMSLISLQLLIYFIDKASIVSIWYGSIGIILNIALVMYPIYLWRVLNGNTLNFGEGFRIGTLVYAGGSFIYIVFQYILHNMIDPQLSTFMYERTIEKTTMMLERFNMPEEEIEAALDKLDPEQMKFTAQTMVIGYFMGLGLGALYATISALIFRKKPISDYTN
jgi:hypothetical protein